MLAAEIGPRKVLNREREDIRMVQAADIQAKSRGHLDEYRGQIEEGYRDWFESSIDNL